MISNIYILIVFFIIILWYIYNSHNTFNENIYQISDLDNQTYLIRRGFKKSPEFLKDSANKLAEINNRINILINYLQNNNVSFSKYLVKNYNFEKISEAAYDTRYTTYTINKNEMHICLRTRDSQENLYDTNLLMYVILHELAHMCNYNENGEPIVGHGTEFKEKFKYLVDSAIKLNLYTFQNYQKNPSEYCGMYISSTITQ